MYVRFSPLIPAEYGPHAHALLLREKVTAWGVLAAIMHAREARQAFVRSSGLEDLERMLVRVRLGVRQRTRAYSMHDSCFVMRKINKFRREKMAARQARTMFFVFVKLRG